MEALHLTAVAFLLTWTGVKGAVTQAVRLQQTVSLHCELRLQDETIWFIHRADGTLSLGMIANINPVDPETDPFIYMRRPDSRFSLVRNPSTNSSSLRIENVMETDQGLYYCATRENGEIHIGKGTRLLIAENSELFEMGLPCLIVLLSAVPLSALASSCCVFFIFLRGRGAEKGKRIQNRENKAGATRWNQE